MGHEALSLMVQSGQGSSSSSPQLQSTLEQVEELQKQYNVLVQTVSQLSPRINQIAKNDAEGLQANELAMSYLEKSHTALAHMVDLLQQNNMEGAPYLVGG